MWLRSLRNQILCLHAAFPDIAWKALYLFILFTAHLSCSELDFHGISGDRDTNYVSQHLVCPHPS